MGLKLVDEQGNEITDGRTGEIVLTGSGFSSGYWGQHAADTGLTRTLADGVWFLHVRTVDGVGNGSPAVHLGPFYIDTAAPTSQVSALAALQTSASFTVSWSGQSGSGSPIDSWKPGAFYAATKSHPWDDAMQRAHLALKAGTLKGILWHQGESDSTDALAPGYAAKLHELVARLRKEFDAPEVPFIAGQMGQFEGAPWNDPRKTVDQAHQDLPKKVKHTAFVSAAGLNHKGDKLHFDAASCREFGKRYAEAYKKLSKEQAAPAR